MGKDHKGIVQIYTGDGKGKTSAALGAVLRAAGHNLRVYVVFFMKGKYSYGEFSTLSRLPGVQVASFGLRCFTDRKNIDPEEAKQAKMALAAARDAMLSGNYDLIVLDEVNISVYFKLIELDDVIQLINDRPKNVNLILTGRNADARIIALADLATEMVKLKHHYDKGVKARKGIEF